ncbi:MAG: GntR family transcriptional regulator [Mogibacterium sp.]|nr:GntR family transcriptional regulator [Mogibacterium sp.]
MDEKLSTRVYEAVRKEILEGVYSARDFISEAQIAKKFGVSKAPVKEALHTLADQGYLVSYPRRGYMVNVFSDEEIDKIQEIRKVLEALCVRNAMKYASKAEIESLRNELPETGSAVDPRETVNYRFHIGLAKLSGNEYLVETLDPLVMKASLSGIKRDADVKGFLQILDAMLDGDEALALQLLDQDIRYLRRRND